MGLHHRSARACFRVYGWPAQFYFTFLAPVGVGKEHEPRHGDALAFSAATMPIFPDDNVAYGRETSFGTAIKLYEYQYIGERSNIIFGKRVILRRLGLLLPEIALPVRLYEFRQNAAGKVLPKGSRETTLVGLRRRLIDNPNVEDGFPIQLNFSPEGEKLIAEVYVFKPKAPSATPTTRRTTPRIARNSAVSSHIASGKVSYSCATARRKATCPAIFSSAIL
jgi:hypothetical protein